ncbi:MAG: four helix bundle protein [Chloroflexia bacterium]|nr:four helix bundle protein [Chloroflexia bacterium]
MENQDWIDYKIEVRYRLRSSALLILELSEQIPKTNKGNVINYQLTKSGTSTYANYRAALRARSKTEFFSKLSIVVEEIDETEMWLDLLLSSKICGTEFTKELHAESLELLKIIASMRKRLN